VNHHGRSIVKSRSLAVLGISVLFAGCNSDSATGPAAAAGLGSFAQSITLPEFENVLINAPTRVEIKLINGILVAREVEVKEREELQEEEEIESRITAIDPAGNLTLSLGGLVVGFNAGTRFETEDGHLSMQEFVTRVQDALAEGRNPAVEAKRNPADTPQAPDDATFLATELELDHDADEDEIEINVDGDNFATTATPPPDAILTVLNLPIELDVTGGVTEIESEIEDDRWEEVDFEGFVTSVSGSSFTIGDGTVIEIRDDTEIERGDDRDELGSLAEVERALAAGLRVEADGEGVIVGTEPRTIVASEVEFEVENDRP
jgi:hypothetical protein